MKGANGGNLEWQAVPCSAAATLKAREAVSVFVLGTTIRTLSKERVDLVDKWSMTISEMLAGGAEEP